MTIRTSEVAHPSSDLTLRWLFSFLDFMRTASPTGPGWTVDQSSDGVTGGAGDNIVDFNDLTTFSAGVNESWFVLQAPDGSKQILFHRTSTNDALWSIRVSPTAAYAGGDAGNPPTDAGDWAVVSGQSITSTGVSVAHYLADDAAPYGFAAYMHLSGAASSARGAMAYVPITSALQPGEVDPYVFIIGNTSSGFILGNTLEVEAESATSSRVVGLVPGSTVNTLPALTYTSQFGDMFPDAAPQDDNGADLSMPISFGRRAGISGAVGFKGISTFVQWNGTARAPLETFAAQTRISFGPINFGWDGSIPSAT